jgi:hypothetical protein
LLSDDLGQNVEAYKTVHNSNLASGQMENARENTCTAAWTDWQWTNNTNSIARGLAPIIVEISLNAKTWVFLWPVVHVGLIATTTSSQRSVGTTKHMSALQENPLGRLDGQVLLRTN